MSGLLGWQYMLVLLAIRDLDGGLIMTISRNLLLENGLIVPTQKVRYAHL